MRKPAIILRGPQTLDVNSISSDRKVDVCSLEDLVAAMKAIPGIGPVDVVMKAKDVGRQGVDIPYMLQRLAQRYGQTVAKEDENLVISFIWSGM